MPGGSKQTRPETQLVIDSTPKTEVTISIYTSYDPEAPKSIGLNCCARGEKNRLHADAVRKQAYRQDYRVLIR